MLKVFLLLFIQIASAEAIPLEIAEVFPNPSGQDINTEYIIMKNTGNFELDLSELYLDDREGESSPFKLTGYSIAPLGEITLMSQETGISINNNSDEVRILDKNLEPIITLEIDNAEENRGYSENTTNENPPVITEILPNPEGTDEGNEWIKICNNSNSSINLNNYFLDDSEEGSDPFQLSDMLYPTDCRKITDSESGITLNNSGDSVRILDMEKNIISETSYENAKEDEIIYLIDTLTKESEPVTSVIITEIMPSPEKGETEWIEIKNTSQEEISLNGLFLDDSEDGSNPYDLSGITLGPFEYKSIEKTESKLSLNNDSDSARILTSTDEEIDSISYETTQKGFSYQLITIIDQATLDSYEEWQWAEPTKDTSSEILYSIETEIIGFENETITTQDYEFDTSTLEISGELKKTSFAPNTKIELTYKISDNKNEITSFETENGNESQSTVKIGQTENSLYKRFLPYITTAIIAIILTIYEYKKGGA
ncbi:MAG: lamin tail domain-containing protein [Candidatus Gracilibacteria bacterium]